MPEPSPSRQELATELRTLRAMAGVSGRTLAKRLGVSQGTTWRIENAATLPTREQAEAWLRECGADPARTARVLAMLDAEYRESPSWSRRLAGRSHLQGEAAGRERGSAVVRNFQPTIVPGLLQTAEYARHVLPIADVMNATDHAAALTARLDRQSVLHEEGRRFEFLLGERALRWAPGPGVMAAQLDRIASLATLEAVEVGVLPDAAPGVVPWHNFVMQFPADGSPPYVTAELISAPMTVTGPDVQLFDELWQRMWSAAVVGDDAVEMIRRMA